MQKPDWRNLELDAGVLREPSPDEGRLILWLPEQSDASFRHWERVGNVPGADITVQQGLCSTPATAVRTQQQVRGFFGKLLGPFRKSDGRQTWVLPNGEAAEQSGERRTDLLLVWAEDAASPVDEARVRARWPQGQRFRQLAKNLFLVAGVEQKAAPAPLQGNPREQAEQLLAAARQAGNRQDEASALIDLGVVLHRSGDAARAVTVLEEALALARQLGDKSRESDVLGNLALALLSAGQPGRTLGLLEQSLLLAREAGNRYQEKIALDQLAAVYGHLRDNVRSLAAYEQALALAREVGDRPHQAELLWFVAIQHAELGRRDQALALAQESIGLYEKLGNPSASVLAEHLQRFRRGDDTARLGGAVSAMPQGAFVGSWTIDSSWSGSPGVGLGQGQAGSGPGLLRMAISAAKSMAKFVGSGMKTVPPATHQKRLRTCATCEHHTGVRCKLCGCFTTAKAWMPHEDCPIGKWQA